MKRTGKLFALLAAIVMALVLVPRIGLAEAGSGVLGTATGSITVSNARKGETYSIYRLFELASFEDTNTDTAVHGTNNQEETYSYVINDSNNPWYTFLTEYGPNGSSDTNKYAVLSDARDSVKNSAYFIIDKDAITIKGTNNTDVSTYHVIKPTNNFSNAWDLPDSQSVSNDDDGNPKDGNIMSDEAGQGDNIKYGVVQRFAQEALKYATTASNNVEKADDDKTASADGSLSLLSNVPLGYYLVGTTMGTLASLDTSNPNVTIYEKNDEPQISKAVLKKGSAIPSTPSYSYLTDSAYDSTDGDTNNGWWVENTDADAGDFIQYRIIVTAQQGAKNYVIHDIVESGMTYAPNNTIAISGTSQNRYSGYNKTNYLTQVYFKHGNVIYEVPITADSKTNYDLVETETELQDDCTFEIRLRDSDGDTPENLVRLHVRRVGSDGSYEDVDIQDGDEIIVTYWCKLNSDWDDAPKVYDDDETADSAVTIKDEGGDIITTEGSVNNPVSDKRNTNSAILTYGDKSCTRWEDAKVTTYQFDVVKTDASSGAAQNLLDNAKFSLYKAYTVDSSEDYTLNGVKYKKEGSALVFATGSANEYYYAGDSTTSANTNQSAQLTSNKNNKIHLEGLEAGTYLLIEDTAPNGYNKLSHPIVVTINDDVSDDGEDSDNNEGFIKSVFTNNGGVSTVTPNEGFAKPDATIETGASGNPATYTSTNNGGIQIVNQTGQELPSTGGLGTKAFYAIGGSLFAASVIFLLTKKRLMQTA